MPMFGPIRTQADLTRLIPRHMRASVDAGGAPAYRVTAPDYDRLLVDTFLVETVMGTGGRVPQLLGRIVSPNDPSAYPRAKLTKEGRLVYVCWAGGDTTGYAVRMLAEPTATVYRHVILPSDPRHAMVAAFKLACDMRRAWQGGKCKMSDAVLVKALGVEPFGNAPEVLDMGDMADLEP